MFTLIQVALLVGLSPVFAQDVVMPEITVMGHADVESESDHIPNATEITGLKLEHRKKSTLGETLSREAGVSASFFGPNASRPVIRGLEGERIRILQNGIGVLDASGTSPDHAVASDPLLIERIEIVRGAAALLYTTNPIGGVVNTVSSRIPNRNEYDSPFTFDSRLSSVDQGRSAGVLLNQKVGNAVLHVDGVARGSENYAIPGFARSSEQRRLDPLAPGLEVKDKVVNSAGETLDGAIGGSYFFPRGHLGASLSHFNTKYGTVAEPSVVIDMNRTRLDAAGEVRDLGTIETLQVKTAGSFYVHKELDAGEVGTTFRNRGVESRVDAIHRPLDVSVGDLTGRFGLQHHQFYFEAAGSEAFLPTTKNEALSAFLFEELKLGLVNPTWSARVEAARVMSRGGGTFGAATSRSFVSPSVAAGFVVRPTLTTSYTFTAALTSRAPNYQELFAAGDHVATGIYEEGSTSIGRETAKSLELTFEQKGSSRSARVSIFAQDYNRFLALTPVGLPAPGGSTLKYFRYRAVHALLAGAEAEWKQRLPIHVGSGTWSVELRADFTRGRNQSDGENLPRMPPLREALGLSYQTDALVADIEVERSEQQGFVAPGDLVTPAYMMVNLGADFPIKSRRGDLHLMARVQNLLDTEARSAVSFLKDLAPLPGRNFMVGFEARL